MSKNNKNDSAEESRPEWEALYKRVTQWREEIGDKTRPDMGRLSEALNAIEKAGMKGEFVLFVVILCEWSFRVRLPLPLHVRRALKFKLNQEGYSPFRPRNPFLRQIQTKNIPPLIDHYVDVQLQGVWNEDSSELSRVVLRDKFERLVKDFTKPFQVAGFRVKSPRKGGYPWQAPWIASTVIYELLRELHTKKRDSQAIEAALTLAQALLGRLPDQSQFHRKRREILKSRADLPQWFVKRYKNFTVAHKLTIAELLDPNFEISTFTVIW